MSRSIIKKGVGNVVNRKGFKEADVLTYEAAVAARTSGEKDNILDLLSQLNAKRNSVNHIEERMSKRSREVFEEETLTVDMGGKPEGKPHNKVVWPKEEELCKSSTFESEENENRQKQGCKIRIKSLRKGHVEERDKELAQRKKSFPQRLAKFKADEAEREAREAELEHDRQRRKAFLEEDDD